MFKSCTKKYTDESDAGVYRFTFYCDICGETFRPGPLRFSGNDPPEKTEEKRIWKLIWKREHAQAFERADFEARHHFFSCPGCGLLSCEKCTVTAQEKDGSVSLLRCAPCNKRILIGKPPFLRYVFEPAPQRMEERNNTPLGLAEVIS